MSRTLSNTQIWGAPVVLGLLSAVGLVAALVADGLGDVISWVILTSPVVVCLRPRRPDRTASAAPDTRPTRPVAPPPGA